MQGALLVLPHDGFHEDVIRTKVFEDYIRDHVDSWFSFARRCGLVERMEDLILVSGRTLVTSWAAATFWDEHANAEFSLMSQARRGGGARFDWNEVGPSVAYRNSLQALVRYLSLMLLLNH